MTQPGAYRPGKETLRCPVRNDARRDFLYPYSVINMLDNLIGAPPWHEKNAPKTGSNTRNGYSSKTVLCDDGEIELNTSRDRENTFEPQLIEKHQTRITQMDSQILSLYAKSMTTREIAPPSKRCTTPMCRPR